MHGFPRFTKDADLWLRDSPPNISRAEAALRNFGAPQQTIDALEAAAQLDVVWMGAPPVRIDLMKGVPGGDFDQAWTSKIEFEVAGVSLWVVGRTELIRLKHSSGRPQDLVDAARLAELD